MPGRNVAHPTLNTCQQKIQLQTNLQDAKTVRHIDQVLIRRWISPLPAPADALIAIAAADQLDPRRSISAAASADGRLPQKRESHSVRGQSGESRHRRGAEGVVQCVRRHPGS